MPFTSKGTAKHRDTRRNLSFLQPKIVWNVTMSVCVWCMVLCVCSCAPSNKNSTFVSSLSCVSLTCSHAGSFAQRKSSIVLALHGQVMLVSVTSARRFPSANAIVWLSLFGRLIQFFFGFPANWCQVHKGSMNWTHSSSTLPSSSSYRQKIQISFHFGFSLLLLYSSLT